MDSLTPTRTAALIVLLAGAAAAAVVLFVAGSWIAAAGFVGAAIVAGGIAIAWRLLAPIAAPMAGTIDWSLARAIGDAGMDPIAITDRAGHLVCANQAYEARFPTLPTPPSLPLAGEDVDRLTQAGKAAWRDGYAATAGLAAADATLDITVTRAGDEADMLVWRIAEHREEDRALRIEAALTSGVGERLGKAGVMAALLAPDGHVRSANRVLSARALGGEGSLVGRDFADTLITDSRGFIRFEREGLEGTPLRIVQLPLPGTSDAQDGDGSMLIALLDDHEDAPAIGASAAAHVRSLVSLMPFGIALVDREGRFLQMNQAFARAAGVAPADAPIYPGDLVVREDKAAVADAIRRFAGGVTHSADMAVRLKGHPDEPVALTIAGARGLGEAAVLLSLKDNSEEIRLKREVAQATKMQAVGQLAGGVAHDFNNILTGILGHCDLMLMRHSPGDSDYDDIQQVRTNANRAASLTRQLLAFSRQQTLRPQVLQLPDIVSEVSTLLKRLMGETVRLDVTHGRALGAVRADPGQLEQVVVNLAVNARDAIVAQETGSGGAGSGTLTIRTFAVSAADVRALGNDVLPPADYTAMSVSDTGTGIPAEILPKIFEPFFTTKELGKGTGLGLSTVYGIVKQSGGWIFADSTPGEGTCFTIYLPVHTAAVAEPLRTTPKPAARGGGTWGQGTVLLVEDEDMVRAIAERALTRQGYTVLTAENGEVALELIDRIDRPDLLISDVVMPVVDGPTMARRVRERYPDIPVLFMSGYAEEQLRRSIDLDHVQFLPKPFSVQQLADAARDALATG